jgi:transketolase
VAFECSDEALGRVAHGRANLAEILEEAAQAASHYHLGNINAFIDRNGLSMDGPTEEIMCLEPMRQRWEAFGWRIYEIDGHDMEAIVDVIDKLPPATERKPTVVIAHTVKGKGVDFMENNPIWHYSGLDREKSLEAVAMIEKNRPARRV